jgi:hypothetical protein
MKITQICITTRVIGGVGAITATTERLGQKHFVHIAPAPVLPRFEGLYDGVLGLMKVLASVLVLGRVTAADVTADKTLPQVDPGVAHLQTLFAAFAAWLDRANFFCVWAGGGCSGHGMFS